MLPNAQLKQRFQTWLSRQTQKLAKVFETSRYKKTSNNTFQLHQNPMSGMKNVHPKVQQSKIIDFEIAKNKLNECEAMEKYTKR
jgi:hypothetical protein